MKSIIYAIGTLAIVVVATIIVLAEDLRDAWNE
jgi:hypothetical protein